MKDKELKDVLNQFEETIDELDIFEKQVMEERKRINNDKYA